MDRCRRRCRRCFRPWRAPSRRSGRRRSTGRCRALVRTVRMAERGNEQPIGVARIDGDVGNLLRVAQSEVRPRLAGVGRLVDAVARSKDPDGAALAAADVDDVLASEGAMAIADRTCGLLVEDRNPDAAGVGRLPHAASGARQRADGLDLTGLCWRASDVVNAMVARPGSTRKRQFLPAGATRSSLASPSTPRRYLLLHGLRITDDDERHLVRGRGIGSRSAGSSWGVTAMHASRRSPGTRRRARAGRRRRAG